MELEIKKLDPRARVPAYAYESDAGLDLCTLEEVSVPAGKYVTGIRTGIAMAIPEGHVGLCWAKSGLASKYGIIVMAGVIDAGYRGELLLTVFNAGDKDYTFKAGDKVMQILIQPVVQAEIMEVKELSLSERGSGGFGSSGK